MGGGGGKGDTSSGQTNNHMPGSGCFGCIGHSEHGAAQHGEHGAGGVLGWGWKGGTEGL